MNIERPWLVSQTWNTTTTHVAKDLAGPLATSVLGVRTYAAMLGNLDCFSTGQAA